MYLRNGIGMKERRIKILDYVTSKEKIKVAELAKLMNVSEVTIRTDLQALEDKGLLTRIHGGAISKLGDNVSNRLKYNYQIKKSIAAKAAEMVSEGETVMIESGSTNAILAQMLAETRRISIITNSFFIADFINGMPNAHLLLLGGDFQNEPQVCYGPLTIQAMQNFFVDKVFIGTDGVSDEGFTNVDIRRAQVVSEMAKRANNVVVITDSSKFYKRGVAKELSFDDITHVITDAGIPDDSAQLLKTHNIKLITVPQK